ncbi:hypothetical protein BT93_G1031 [Corymbia citriodora subsp. variegata]|nr:hypothetical protein BT93_G1031 [Corymbia citriodora subsp. variegata]
MMAEDKQESEGDDGSGTVAIEAVHAASASSQPPPRSVPPPSSADDEEEEVVLILDITKTLAMIVNRNSSVEHVKALIQDKVLIDDECSKQLFFGERPLEDGMRLANYGIRGRAIVRVLLRDSVRTTVIVHMLPAQKILLFDAKTEDTIQDLKMMVQIKEGILPDDFTLFLGGERLAEERTLASLNLPPEPTIYLVLNPKQHLSVTVIVVMSSHRVAVDAELWFTVGHVKALAIAKMSAHVQVMSSPMVYQGELLDDQKTLAYYDIADGSMLRLVSPHAPFQIFVDCGNGQTVALQVCRSDTVKELKQKLLQKLPVNAPVELHGITHVGRRLADDHDLASYGIQENSTLFGIFSPLSKSNSKY